jgi:hypothetical protein
MIIQGLYIIYICVFRPYGKAIDKIRTVYNAIIVLMIISMRMEHNLISPDEE